MKTERQKLKHFEKSFSRLHELDDPQKSNELDPYRILWVIFCMLAGLYIGIIVTILTNNFLCLPFTFITTYVIAQYHVVLEAITYPSEMIGEIKKFSLLFVIDIILLIIILV